MMALEEKFDIQLDEEGAWAAQRALYGLREDGRA